MNPEDLVGFFKSLLGIERYEGAINAALANHLLATGGDALRMKLVQRIAYIEVAMRKARDERSALLDLNRQSRATQLNFAVIACNNLGVAANIPGYVFYEVENPYRMGASVEEEHMNAVLSSIRKDCPTLAHWPGNASKLDLLSIFENGGRLVSPAAWGSVSPPTAQNPTPSSSSVSRESDSTTARPPEGLRMEGPPIGGGTPVRLYECDRYQALLMRDPEVLLPGINYLHVLLVFEAAVKRPVMFICAEQSGLSKEMMESAARQAGLKPPPTFGSAVFLNVYVGSQRQNLGTSPEYAILEKFELTALSLMRSKLDVRSSVRLIKQF